MQKTVQVVGIALGMFLRLSFTVEATGDRMRTLPVIGVFSLSFQAKRSVFTSCVNKLSS